MPTTHGELELDAGATAGASWAVHPTTPASSTIAIVIVLRNECVLNPRSPALGIRNNCVGAMAQRRWGAGNQSVLSSGQGVALVAALCGYGGEIVGRRCGRSEGREWPRRWISVSGAADAIADVALAGGPMAVRRPCGCRSVRWGGDGRCLFLWGGCWFP